MTPGADDGNGRVRDAVLEAKLDHLTKQVEKVIEDHEARLRCLEKASPWRTLAEAVTGVISVAAMYLGFRQ